MTDRILYNIAILPETRKKIADISVATYRNIGQTVDWLVAEAWERMEQTRIRESSVEDALEAVKYSSRPE